MSERVQKILANAGCGSRRAIEKLIAEGKVKVNGEVISLGTKAELTDKFEVDGKLIRTSTKTKKAQTIIYNKPEGEICTRSDPEGRPTVFEKLPRLKGERWISVGRLDINSSGLLIFTTDGELAHRLMHPKHNIEREYAARILGKVNENMIKNLLNGVKLEDGFAKFEKVIDAGGTGANHWYHCIITEGKQREVRRLWDSQGVRVSRLIRIRFGDVLLPPRLRAGQWESIELR